MSYLLKTNPVNFTLIGEEPRSENNHLYFSAGTFPVGTQEQIPLFFIVCEFKMCMRKISFMPVRVSQISFNMILWELGFK